MREKLFSGGYREIHKRRETKQKAKKQAPQWEAVRWSFDVSAYSITQGESIFKLVGGIPAVDVFKAFCGGEVRKNKAPCPFHNENSPSFHIYENSFYCFGCGWGGDNTAFVAKLLNLRPLNAARAIAEHFNIPVSSRPLTRQDRLKLSQAKAELELEKKLQAGFKQWAKAMTYRVRGLTEAIRSVAEEQGVNTPLLEHLALFEYWGDVLAMGTDEERLELYRDNGFRRWLRWQ